MNVDANDKKRSGTDLGLIGNSKRYAYYKAVGVINDDHTEHGYTDVKPNMSCNSVGYGVVTNSGRKRKAADEIPFVILNDEYPPVSQPRLFGPRISERLSECSGARTPL